jgi:hypothetical protein
MKIIKKYWIIALVIIFCFLLGFILKGITTKKIKTVYVKGDEIHDTIFKEKLVPYSIKQPQNPELPIKHDTLILQGGEKIVTMKVDTLAIISKYIQENSYRNVLFDNNNGKLVVGATVQYNELRKLNYDFTPIQKQTTITKEPLFIPHIDFSYNSFGYFGAGGGIFIKDLGINGKYITDFKKSGFEIGLGYKF